MKISHTRDTMSQIYLDALKIRTEVFVNEQQIPLSIELDSNEAYAIHFVLYTDENHPVATLRLLPIDEQTLKIQRMAVLEKERKKGYAQQLIQFGETFAKEQGFQQLTLGAQVQAHSFYTRLGFQDSGPTFTEANLLHVPMVKKII